MSPFDYFVQAFTEKYADFSGRARRSEYWYFALFSFLAAVVAMIIDSVIGYPVFYILYALASLVPGLALAVRRLHDTNKSGWYLLIAFIPLIGAIVLLVFVLTDSDVGSNKYGPNPKDGVAATDDILDHLVD